LRPYSRQRPSGPGNGLGAAHVGAAGKLGHPLAAGPATIGIAAGQARQCPLDEGLVAGAEQRARGAVAHRQGAGVHIGGGVKEVGQGELHQARGGPVGALVGQGHQPVLGGKTGGPLPERRKLDLVDPLAPGVPLGEQGLVAPVGEVQTVQLAAGQFAHPLQDRRRCVKHVWRERAPQKRAQHAIIGVLVAQPGGRLLKEVWHHWRHRSSVRHTHSAEAAMPAVHVAAPHTDRMNILRERA